jgi:hypothetical protein
VVRPALPAPADVSRAGGGQGLIMILAVYRCLAHPQEHVLYIEADRATLGLDPECPWDGFHMPRGPADLVLPVEARWDGRRGDRPPGFGQPPQPKAAGGVW